MATIRFNVKPAAGNLMQIRAIFQNGDEQITKNLGESIPANKVSGKYKYWDNASQQVRNIDREKHINAKIQKWKSAFTTYMDDCERHEKEISIQEFISILTGHRPVLITSPTLLSIIASFIKSIAITHDGRTCRMYKVLEHDITDMQTHNGEVYTIGDIDNGWYKKFTIYLITQENNFNAIINKKQGKIVTILKYAQDDLKLKPNPDYHKKYNVKTVKAPKFPLHPEELATLWVAHITGIPDDKHTRNDTSAAHREILPADATYRLMCLDAFLLATETGMRYSDIVQLKPVHIISHVTPAGQLIDVVDLTEIKTDDITTMALSDKAMQIINRYTTDNKHAPLFSFSASQAVGKILKAIFKNLEVTRPCELIKKQGAKTIREILPLHDVISFHMARNTFITRLLAAGLPLVHVQDNVGHSKPEVTMGYFRNEDITRFQATLAILNAPAAPKPSAN